MPANYLEDFKNLYLKINYSGDKAKLYLNHRLIEDDFNNGSTWTIGLNNFKDALHNGSLQLEINPVSANTKIYFDDVKAGKNSAKATLHNLRLVPQYETKIDISNL